MAGPDDAEWERYYAAQAGRSPRPLLTDVARRFEGSRSLRAIDLGCGDGTETRALLQAGWHVLAIDREPSAIARLLASLDGPDRERLEVQVRDFASAELPVADLVFCGWSLPHCPADQLGPLWARIRGCLSEGGRFAGQILGARDDWTSSATTAWVSQERLDRMLAGLDVEHRVEVDEDRDSFDGPKHWHYFEIIARNPSRDRS